MGYVHHGQAQVYAHLRGRQADTMGRDHRFQHVIDKFDNSFINLVDVAAFLAQDGVAILGDF